MKGVPIRDGRKAVDSFWRTLVAVERIGTESYFVRVPGWEPRAMVRVPAGSVPRQIQEKICCEAERNGLPVRLHAEVNIGVEDMQDLAFRHWEF